MKESKVLSDGRDPSASDAAGTVAYIAQVYPLLTETFIYREVLGLRRRGIPVVTFAVRKPRERGLSSEARHLVDESRYVFPLNWPRFITAHLWHLITHPVRYAGTLLFVVTRRGESLRNRILCFLHFGMGVYLAKEMQKHRVVHIHAHFAINAATIALVLSRLLHIPFSFTAHNLLFTQQVLLKEKVNASRFIVAVSDYTRRFLLDRMPGDGAAAKVHVIHCGVSPDAFTPPAARPRNEPPVILFVAQLTERKGAPFLVEACRILAGRGVPFRCDIIGDGPQRALLERQVAAYGLQGSVGMPGAVTQENLREHLSRADLFVLPCVTAADGDLDGIPVSLMEAMAMEIPAVSTPISGIPELIEDGHSGLLVKEKDGEALADAIQRLIEDRGLRARLGAGGRRRVCEAFHIDKTTAELAALLEKRLDRGR